MIIENINDQTSINETISTMQKDIKAMSKAMASLKKQKMLLKKVSSAHKDGRMTTTLATNFYSQIQQNIENDLIIIQDRGMALGQGDIGCDHDECAKVIAQHIITTTK
jgi:hypothetical protein